MSFGKTALFAAALSLFTFGAAAEEYTLGDLNVSKTWTRATPPKAKAGGGFVEIRNTGSESDRLIGVASDVANKVEIHEMAITDGIMKMRELEAGIEIPAGETVTLKPGGLHIMFMGIKEPFKEGGTIPVELTFEKAGSVSVELDIAKIGAKSMDGHGEGHGHSHEGHKHN